MNRFIAMFLGLVLVAPGFAQPTKETMMSGIALSTTPVTSSILNLPRGCTEVLLDIELIDGDAGTTHNTTLTPVWALYGDNNGGVATRLFPDTGTITHSEAQSNHPDFLGRITTVPFMASGLYIVADTEGARVANITGYAKGP